MHTARTTLRVVLRGTYQQRTDEEQAHFEHLRLIGLRACRRIEAILARRAAFH